MYDSSLRNWRYSSIKGEFERSMAGIADATRNFDSLKREIDSQMRDYRYAQSSLERAIQELIRDAERSAGSKSGYSSRSYSGANGRIRDAQRIMERCLSKVTDCVARIAEIKRKIESCHSEAGRKFSEFSRAYDDMMRALASTTKELHAESQKLECVSREKSNAERESKAVQNRLQAEMDRVKRTAAAGMAAAAFTANAASKVDAAASEIRRLDAERKEWKQRAAEMKRHYEREIANLKASMNDGVSDQEKVGDPCCVDDACEPSSNLSKLAADYAHLWNAILDDDVIEFREVKQIRDWVAVNVAHMPEGIGLMDLCDEVLDRGTVLPIDAQSLYDRSFMLLKELGAKLG